MNPPLTLLRYLLLLAPAVSLPYMSAIPSYPELIIRLLLLLALVRIRERWAPERWSMPLLLAEAAWSAWLHHSYGGHLYMFFWSAAVSLFQRGSAHLRRQLLLALFAAMLLSAPQLDMAGLTQAAIGFLCLSAVLLRAALMEVGQVELQQLYDELRLKHYELEEARKRILEYASKVEDSAQLEERNRIAREIHDDLGHKLIRLKMMLEAVLHIMPSQPDKGMEMVRQVRDQLTDSMETMRKTVRRLAPDEADVHSWSLDRLIEELSREPGFRVRYEVTGQPVPLYPSCEIVLYRNAQEAITNAIRHGRADEVDIQLRYEERSVTLRVSNNGEVPEGMNRKGLGVSGMEERTGLVGGTLQFDFDGRFSVITRIPLIHS